tara:strand:- start:1006 stop:1671 length:666 start_codon:yes stop_codon:yes gene_type:complete
MATFTSNSIELNGGAKFQGGSNGFLADAPAGTVIKSGSYYTGSGPGASTTSSSRTPYTININGTGQKLFNLTKASDDVLVFNKISNSSHLEITPNFHLYNGAGNSGAGLILKFSINNGGSYLTVPDTGLGVTSGLDSQGSIYSSWGFGGYGGATSDAVNPTYNTYHMSQGTNFNDILTKTGDVRFFFQGMTHSSSDTIYWLSYQSNSWLKAGFIHVKEIKV